MISNENEELRRALEKLKILIVPKNIAIYNDENLITELYLSRFGMKEIPSDFFTNPIFEHLEKLFLNSNKLIDIKQNLFKPLNQLKYLNLGRNYLTSIDKDTFSSLQALEELDVSNNNISQIDTQSFSNLQNLTILNIRNNQLEKIPDDLFFPCKNLVNLDLSINKFRVLPKALKVFHDSNLQFLNLNGNYIPSEFAKAFKARSVIHSFLSELNEFWKNEDSNLDLPDLDKIIKQYLFDSLMSVYHYSINVPVLNYSLLSITLNYMTKNFHLLSSYFADKKIDLSFRQTLSLWYFCLYTFAPVEDSLVKLLDTHEEDTERQRRILERKQKLMSELEREVMEHGGIMDYKFKKIDIERLELEPVHENLFNLIKQYLKWNIPEYSTVFI